MFCQLIVLSNDSQADVAAMDLVFSYPPGSPVAGSIETFQAMEAVIQSSNILSTSIHFALSSLRAFSGSRSFNLFQR